jgi:ferric-dicitrate binding protein FerR (iron transport regulator)
LEEWKSSSLPRKLAEERERLREAWILSEKQAADLRREVSHQKRTFEKWRERHAPSQDESQEVARLKDDMERLRAERDEAERELNATKATLRALSVSSVVFTCASPLRTPFTEAFIFGCKG